MRYLLLIVLTQIFQPALLSNHLMINSLSLPLKEYENSKGNHTLVIYVSGDGGINNFSDSLCKEFLNKGFYVVALDSKKYFWSEKTPEQFTLDIEQIAEHYMNLWKSTSLVLVGYSFGADVVAYLPERLSKDLLKSIKFTALVTPSASTDFEIRLIDMLGNSTIQRKYDVPGELNNIQTHPVLCLLSEDEKNSIEDRVHNDNIEFKILPGGHRFNNNYMVIVNNIFKMLDKY